MKIFWQVFKEEFGSIFIDVVGLIFSISLYFNSKSLFTIAFSLLWFCVVTDDIERIYSLYKERLK